MTARSTSILLAGAFACGAALLYAAEQKPPAAAKRSAPVAVGEIAPHFTLADHHGSKHSLSAQRGKQPMVLVFYRGHW